MEIRVGWKSLDTSRFDSNSEGYDAIIKPILTDLDASKCFDSMYNLFFLRMWLFATFKANI